MNEERLESQISRVKRHLVEGKSITPMDALNLFGAFRLSHIIYFLRNEGYNIKTDLIYDGIRRYAKYSLVSQLPTVETRGFPDQIFMKKTVLLFSILIISMSLTAKGGYDNSVWTQTVVADEGSLENRIEIKGNSATLIIVAKAIGVEATISYTCTISDDIVRFKSTGAYSSHLIGIIKDDKMHVFNVSSKELIGVYILKSKYKQLKK